MYTSFRTAVGCLTLLLLSGLCAAQAVPKITLQNLTNVSLDCVNGSGSTVLGSVDISVTNGSAPYSYSWSSGQSTQDLTGLSAGIFTVTVTDQNSSTATASFAVGHLVDWTNYAHTADLVPGTLVNYHSNNWCRGAASTNILKANTDGWIEVTADVTNKHKAFGWKTYPRNSACWGNIDYGIYLKNNGTFNRLIGTAQTGMGSYAAGDVIRMQRTGTTIRFYKNGVHLSAYDITNSNVSTNMTIGASIFSFQGQIVDLRTSSKPRVQVDYQVQSPCGSTGSASVDVSVCNGVNPLVFDWQPGGQTTEDLIGQNPESHDLTITSNSDWVSYHHISTGFQTDWQNTHQVALTANGGHEKTTGSSTWEGGAQSAIALPAGTDGWIEYTVRGTDKSRSIGFSTNPSANHTQSSITCGVVLNADGYWYRLLNGATVVFGKYKEGDVIRLEKVGNAVHIYANGYKRNTAYGMSTTLPHYIETSFYEVGAQFEQVRNSWGCTPHPAIYTTLSDRLDGGTYEAQNNQVLFKYESEYNPQNASLTYHVYDKESTIVTDQNDQSLAAAFGSNFRTLDFSSNGFLLGSGHYVLEIINEKSEKKYLRFHIP